MKYPSRLVFATFNHVNFKAKLAVVWGIKLSCCLGTVCKVSTIITLVSRMSTRLSTSDIHCRRPTLATLQPLMASYKSPFPLQIT